MTQDIDDQDLVAAAAVPAQQEDSQAGESVSGGALFRVDGPVCVDEKGPGDHLVATGEGREAVPTRGWVDVVAAIAVQPVVRPVMWVEALGKNFPEREVADSDVSHWGTVGRTGTGWAGDGRVVEAAPAGRPGANFLSPTSFRRGDM